MLKPILDMLFPSLRFAKGLTVAAISVGAAAVGAAGSYAASKNAADAQASAAANANSPWSASQPYIAGEFGPAQDALNKALGMGVYSGQRVASLNPYQTQGADQAAAWANGPGQQTANTFFNSGQAMTGAGTNFGSNASQLFQQATQGDPTQGFLSTASQYANNPYVNQMIDSANLDVSRDLNETQLPSLALGAAGSGNTDSTRTGVAQALLESRAQQNMLANASNIRGQMFNTGLGMAQTQYNTQQQQALGANGQLGSAFQLGNAALLNGQQANGNNFDQLQAAGGVFQNQNQNQLNADQQQFNDQQTVPLNLIGQYMNVINGKWGGAPISSVGPSVAGSTMQGALGGAMMGYGAAGKLGGYSNTYGSGYNFTMPAGYSSTPASDSMQIPAGLSAFGYGAS